MLNVEKMPATKQRGASHAALQTTSIYGDAYAASPSAKIVQIKSGIPAGRVKMLAQHMALPQTTLLKVLGLARSSVSFKSTAQKLLAKDASELVLGVEALIGQVAAMVDESGDATGFDAPKWVARWIETPNPALGGQQPAAFMDTVEGQKLVANILAMAQTGSYA